MSVRNSHATTQPNHSNNKTHSTKPHRPEREREERKEKKKRGRSSPEKQLVFWVLRHVHKISEGKNTQTDIISTSASAP